MIHKIKSVPPELPPNKADPRRTHEIRLLLLPSGPDRVHGSASHGTLTGSRPDGTNTWIIT